MAGLVLSVRLTPKAAQDRLDCASLEEGGAWRLKARVRAVPEDGKANAALVRLIAEELGVPKSAVGLDAGSRSREKRVRIETTPDRLEHALERLRRLSSAEEREPMRRR
ncbi:DUF167 domain-containing protein [Aureimonas populi]|uniref:UPF0235 protein ACFSKQ_14730 n=1 Tax=Aureimonas populi TaxID=1701758 RepID=A0ABW5CSB4_9HYPH|nr:DUF167 domain-containing protein [Aureimonas populi]